MTEISEKIPSITGATLIQKKRFTNELKLLNSQPLGYITAYHDDKNPLIWYFLLVGQKGTQYYGGHYIGEIQHSPKYPAEPPNYIMKTPSGRYEINSKICLTNSGYHKGEWSSTWNIQSILIAFYSIWLDDTEHGISHIKRSQEERAKLAQESIEFNKKNYHDIYSKFNFNTLTDDIDNAPKIVKLQDTDKPPIPPDNNINTEKKEIINVDPIQINNSELKDFTGILEKKFIEINDNILKINEKINIQEDTINELFKQINDII